MKNLMKIMKGKSAGLLVLLMIMGIAGCSNNDDTTVIPDTNATGSIVVNDQTISQNKIVVQSVTTDQDGWLVARNSSAGDNSAVVSDTVAISSGTTQNVDLNLGNTANLTRNEAGDQFTITLYQDNPNTSNGTQGQFDSSDNPVLDSSGNIVSKTITVMAPGFRVQDQTITDNSVSFDSANTADGGFVALYNQNADGSMNANDIVGTQYVNAGSTGAFTVPFNDNFTYTAGQNIYPVLYNDNPADQQFTFPTDNTTDIPETYGFDTNGAARGVGYNPVVIQ